MKSLQAWLDEYAHDHQNRKNKILHKLCVPVIFATVAGAMHLNVFTDCLAIVAILSYLRWGIKPFAIMFLHWLIAILMTSLIWHFAGSSTVWILLALFAVAWVGQFIGHYFERRRPSFLTDIQYLFIGPLWIWLGR